MTRIKPSMTRGHIEEVTIFSALVIAMQYLDLFSAFSSNKERFTDCCHIALQSAVQSQVQDSSTIMVLSDLLFQLKTHGVCAVIVALTGPVCTPTH